MNRLAEALKLGTNVTYTENGAVTHKSTLSAVLDFFATGAAMRTRDESAINKAVEKSFLEDPLLTLRMLFYFRDVRGGQGERRLFRTAMKYIAQQVPEALDKSIHLVPEFGRWDDLLAFIGTPLEMRALSMIKDQWRVDNQATSPSLLAKWLPSENASSKTTKFLAGKVRAFLGLSSKTYRKTLSRLRTKIEIVEKLMCQREFSAINYERVPSNASLKYRKAFSKKDADRYVAFLKDVKKGVKKIHAGTLYPYDLVHEVFANKADDTVDAQWAALPDYFEGRETSGLVIADTSGSMRGQPLEVSISLAMYVGERAKGPFHNMFITFSAQPALQQIRGNTLTEKVRNLENAHWDMNTNVQAAFELILSTAKNARVSQKEMPETLYIVSDMEFDQADSNNSKTNFQSMKSKFEAAGYRLPKVVFWNVNARNDQQPITQNEYGTCLVSGRSPAILKALLADTKYEAPPVKTPYETMLDVLNSPRYEVINL